MFQQEQNVQAHTDGTQLQKMHVSVFQRCIGSILILFQILLPSTLAVLPWCAVIRIHYCENNVQNLLHMVHNRTEAMKPIILILFQVATGIMSCIRCRNEQKQ